MHTTDTQTIQVLPKNYHYKKNQITVTILPVPDYPLPDYHCHYHLQTPNMATPAVHVTCGNKYKTLVVPLLLHVRSKYSKLKQTATTNTTKAHYFYFYQITK